MPAPKRADAQRNRDKILDAARIAFADPDADVSMAEVSRRAGVGMATLYRNFPGRRELLEALYTDEVDAVADTSGLAEDDPAAALEAWLRRFAAFVAGKRHLADELLKEPDDALPFLDSGRARVFATAAPLLEAAQRTRAVRADLTLDQVLELVHAIAKVRGDREPLLQTIFDGLRVTAAQR
jgi:AcrR family transcriptional regulator